MDYVYRKYAEKMQKGTVNRNKNCPSAKDLERFIYSEDTVKRKQFQLASANCWSSRRGETSFRLLRSRQKKLLLRTGRLVKTNL